MCGVCFAEFTSCASSKRVLWRILQRRFIHCVVGELTFNIPVLPVQEYDLDVFRDASTDNNNNNDNNNKDSLSASIPHVSSTCLFWK